MGKVDFSVIEPGTVRSEAMNMKRVSGQRRTKHYFFDVAMR
jgi:hypothetical protein